VANPTPRPRTAKEQNIYPLLRYENVHKMWKMGQFGVVSPKITENSANQYSTYEFLLAFHSNYVPILHRF